MEGSTPPDSPPPVVYGVDPNAELVTIPLDEGIDEANINAYAHGYFAAKYGLIGGYRALDVFSARFLRGDVDIGAGDLQTKICDHVEAERLRFGADERDSVLRRVSDDAKLDRYIARVVDACIAFDLSGRDAFTGIPLPKATAEFMVRTAIEDFQRYLSDAAAGGVGLVVEQATAQLIESFNILDDEDIAAVVPGNDLFDRIVWLTPHETDRPTVAEAREALTLGVAGRQLVLALATEVGKLDTISGGTIAEIGALAQEWQFANGSVNIAESIAEDTIADQSRLAAAQERGLIFFRQR